MLPAPLINDNKSVGSLVKETPGAGIPAADGTPPSPLDPVALGVPNATLLSRHAPSSPPLLFDDSTTAILVNTLFQFEALLELSEKSQGKQSMLKSSRSAIVSTLTEKHLSSGLSKSKSSFHSAKTFNAICEQDLKPLSIVIKDQNTLMDAIHELKERRLLPDCSFTDETFVTLKTGDKSNKYDLLCSCGALSHSFLFALARSTWLKDSPKLLCLDGVSREFSLSVLTVLLLSSVSQGIKSNIYKCLKKTPSYLLDGSIILYTIFDIICVTPFKLQNAVINRLRSVTPATHQNRIEHFNLSIRKYSSLITLTPQQEHAVVKHYFAQMLLYPQSSIHFLCQGRSRWW
jgi:hypothetical protein